MFEKIRALFRRKVVKSQMPLFDTTVRIEGHTRHDGTYVKPHIARRKRGVKPPPHDKHPSATADTARTDQRQAADATLMTEAEWDAIPPGERGWRLESGKEVRYVIEGGKERRVYVEGDDAPKKKFELPNPNDLVTQHTTFNEAGEVVSVRSKVPTAAQRRADNQLAREILERKDNSEITDDDRAVLARYSGNGGCGDSLNEFYTRPDVASAVWQVLERAGGLPGKHVLEPSCGTGVFMQTAPDTMNVTGVEMDQTSNRIATVLHQRHEVMTASPLEAFASTDGRLFDAVVGNPPFGLRGSLLADDKPDIARAEQYFLDTALDKTKTGGIVALVLPSGVLDASSGRAFRRDVQCKGQFLGALRMPNTAFEHSQTSVTTDVVFFRRRAGDVANALLTLDEAQLKAAGALDEEFVNGGYFDGRGSQNIMGTPEPGWRAKAGMGNDITVTGSMDGVAQAIANFQLEPAADITMDQALAGTGENQVARKRAQRAALKSPYHVSRVGDVKLINGQAYILQGDPPRWHATDQVPEGEAEPPHITAARAIGDKITRLMAGEAGAESGAIVGELQKYIQQHGIPRKDAAFRAAAQRDPALHRVLAAVNENGEFSDALAGRSAAKDDVSLEATAERLSLQNGSFDVFELHAQDNEAALDQLFASDKFARDGDRWVMMDQYLTGNLWAKLDTVRAQLATDLSQALATKAKLELQAQRLDAAIDPRSLEDVELAINSAWVPLDVLQGYLDHKRERFLAKNPDAAQWMGQPKTISFEGAIYKIDDKDATAFHGAEKLLLNYLNRTGVKEDDLPAVERMNKSFKRYVLASDHRARVEDLYNRAYRGFVQQRYSDDPIDVPGLTTERDVNKYHWSRIRWALAQRKGIIAADVGLGKTPRALMLAKLLKLHGHAKKPTIVVPKSVLANWLAEIDAWFPGSRTMVIGENYVKGKDGKVKAKADTAEQRNQKYHDLAQNDYDFVLMSAPAWNDLDLSPIKKGEYANSDFWTQRGDSLGQAGDKKLRKIREAYDQAMAKREFDKRSDVIHFDELGIDAVLMDEAHAYKNLFSARSRFGQQPKFLGGSGESNRAIDTNYKTKFIREQNDGKNVFLLTATPTKNSPLEIYSMLSHVAPEEFEARGIRNSEEFIDRYCEFRKDLALDVEGAIEDALITSGFKNMDELRALMRKYIDRQTAEDVGLKLPAKDEQEHLIDMTAEQTSVYSELRALAAEASSDAGGEAHIFSIMDKMGKASLDLELLGHTGAISPKYDGVAAQVKTYVKDGGQIIFCEAVASHQKLKKILTEAGLEAGEVAIVNGVEAPASLDRQKISDAFNAGKVKVVIGNKTMEEGMNLQKQTSDIHHLDIPWEPATLQQRNGRGVRQGNVKTGVRIHRYIAKASFDGYRYQTVAAKKDWQDQLWTGGDRLENLESAPSLSREDMLIMLSADPEAARKKYAENKVVAKAAYEAGQRAKAGAAYHRYRELSRSYAVLPNKNIESAGRLRQRLDDARERLTNDPHFDGKDALTNPEGVAVDAATGRPFRPGSAVHVTFKDKAPFSWADGTHKFVVSAVHPEQQAVSLRPYGQAGAAVRVKTADIAQRAVDAQYNAQAEETDAAANLLGNVAGRAAEEFGGTDSAKVEAAVSQAAQAVAGAEQAWYSTTGGRAKMWRSIEAAIRQHGTFGGSKPADDQIQALVDTAELSLALREHGINPNEVTKPEHLKGVPDAAIVANLDTIHRRLRNKLLNYEASYNLAVPLIGPDGHASVLQNSYEVRSKLADHKLMLPTEQDRRKALDAWKAAQRARQFKRRERPAARHSYNRDYMPGVQPQYGDTYSATHTNPMAAADALFGKGWTAEGHAELMEEATKQADAAPRFADKFQAWLPVVEVNAYGGHARWPAQALRDVAIAAKNEGLFGHKVADVISARAPAQIFDTVNGKQTEAFTTLGDALQRAAAGTNDESLSRQLSEWIATTSDREAA